MAKDILMYFTRTYLSRYNLCSYCYSSGHVDSKAGRGPVYMYFLTVVNRPILASSSHDE